MLSDLKQFVPPEYCFQCKGCCVFDSTVTPWRPFMGQEEKLRSVFKEPQQIFDAANVDPDGYVKAVCEEGKGRCSVFHAQNFRCECYQTRPFECRTYPFMVVEKEGKPFVAAHLSCPYVHEHWRDESFEEYSRYLIERLSCPEIRSFLLRNRLVARPYEAEDQFDFLYEIDLDHTQVSEATLSQRGRMEQAFRATGCRLSAYTFPNLAVWDQVFALDIQDIDGMSCVFASDAAGTFLYYPPLGKGNVKAVAASVFAVMERINAGTGISRMENVPECCLDLFSEDYRCAYKTDEYVYLREDIAGLRGNRYKSKRLDYNHFVRCNEAEFLPYDERMARECLAVYDRWDRQKGDDIMEEARIMMDDARVSHRIMFAHCHKLGFIGRVVKVSGKTVAYTFGYPINETDFCVFAEITDRSFKGLPTFIFREFCRDEAMLPFRRVNVMDCFGLPQLEVTKRSFRPIEVLPVYTVYPP